MIKGKYTLFTRIPLYANNDGVLFSDDLWKKDLEAHLGYIENFQICCPLECSKEIPKGFLELQGLDASQVFGLRRDAGWGSVFRNFLPNFLTVRRAIRNSLIVHSGGAGWAFPLSFYILPLSFLYSFQWVVVIESSFWMKPKGVRATLRQFLSHHLHSFLLGAALKRADARIFTQDGYRKYFGVGVERTLVAPATWINDRDMLTESENIQRVSSLPSDRIRLLFPARLVRDKGADLVLEAISAISLASDDHEPLLRQISIHIIGEGELRDKCEAFARHYQGDVEVRILDTVPYGERFFELLRGYHGVILANRKDEQPRIVFDAFSQGVPIIGSATEGVRDIVTENEDALLFEVGDANGLAQKILEFATNETLRSHLEGTCLNSALGKTHAAMHAQRETFLKDILCD